MTKHLLSLSIAAALLTGCGSDSDSSSSTQPNNSETTSYTTVSGVDGSTTYAYFDFETGKVLTLTDEEAKTNTDWDIAFYSLNVVLNGGHSGPGDVSAYFTGNNSDFYDAEGNAVKDKFINATSEAELADFEAVSVADIPEESEFKTDEFVTRFGSEFYSYNFMDHSISQNDQQEYLVSNTDNTYKVRVTDLSNLVNQAPGRSITEFTLGVQTRNADASFSDEQQIALSACDDQAYISLDSMQEVAATDTWDLNIQCNAFEIHLGDSVTALARNDEDDWSNAIEYAGSDYAAYYMKTDGAETVFKDLHKWYQYGINGENKVWSQYGVYLVNTGETTYKFQITSYYTVGDDGTVAGRNYGFRYEALPEATPAE